MSEEQRDGEDAQRIGEGLGARAGEAIVGDFGGGGDEAFRGEPGGEQAHTHGDGPEAASGDEVIGVRLGPASGPGGKQDLREDVEQDQAQRQCHGGTPDGKA